MQRIATSSVEKNPTANGGRLSLIMNSVWHTVTALSLVIQILRPATIASVGRESMTHDVLQLYFRFGHRISYRKWKETEQQPTQLSRFSISCKAFFGQTP